VEKTISGVGPLKWETWGKWPLDFNGCPEKKPKWKEEGFKSVLPFT